MATKLVARLGADISDYAKQLSEAQRMMATRIANIRAGVREEIALARQVLREKEKLAKMGLDVDVTAARQAFNQRVELARATAAEELKLARKSSAGVGAALEETGKSATRAHGGFGRLSQEMVTVVRQMTGLPPVVAQAGGALGNFAIGAAPMLAILAGLAAIAKAVELITQKSREAKKFIKELREEAEKISKERRQSPEATAFLATLQAKKDLDKARAVLAARQAPGGPQFSEQGIKKAQDEVDRLEKIWTDNLANIGDIARESFEKVADANERAANKAKQAANEAKQAWQQHFAALSEMVAAGGGEPQMAELRVEFERLRKIATDTTRPIEEQAEAFEAMQKASAAIRANMEKLPAVKQGLAGAAQGSSIDIQGGQIIQKLPSGFSADGLKLELREIKAEKMVVPAIPVHVDAAGGGLLGPLKEKLFGTRDASGKRSGGILNPSEILNNALGGLASGGLSLAMGLASKGLNALAHSSLIFGKSGAEAARAVEEAAIKMRVAVANIRAEIARMKGDTGLADFLSVQQEVASRLKEVGLSLRGIEDTSSFSELLALLNKALEQSTLDKFSPDILTHIKLIIELVTGRMKQLGDEVAKTTSTFEALRNVPQGFKIVLERFRATAGVADPRTLSPTGRPHTPGTPIDNSIDVGGITIVQRPGEDGEALAKRVASNLLRLQKRGGTTDLDLAVAAR